MAFSFSFGKKDKNPPEAAAPVAKAPPSPPKIQNPPGTATPPTVKPPQPSGLIPATGMSSGVATTQPMVMPRAGSGLKPTRPGVAQSSRSTQRIVLPTVPGGKSSNTKALSVGTPTGRINLPIGMILRCLPQEVLAADLAEFEASGAAATEIGLPMNMILSQLPSGKVEMPLSDLVPHFPSGYLQPTESIASYLPNLINLPLMDVVMRIPPDLLALRPDQKDVDAAVINMADPFTEEILREQAEAARKQLAEQSATQTNIIEESQVPQEEFVPQDQAPAAKAVAQPPPPRPLSIPFTAQERPAAAATPPATGPSLLPQTSRLPAPQMPPGSRMSGPLPLTSPSTNARTISPSGRLPVPTRATTAIPTRPQTPLTLPIQPSPSAPASRQTTSLPSAPPVPPVPRQTGILPVLTTMPRQTASVPMPTRPAPTAPPPPIAAPPPQAPSAPEPLSAAAVPGTAPVVTDSNADNLQRLAALAMAQMEEENVASEPAPIMAATTPLNIATAPLNVATTPLNISVTKLPPPPLAEIAPVNVPEPVAEVAPGPEPAKDIAPAAIPEPVAVAAPTSESVPASEAAPEVVPVSIPAPASPVARPEPAPVIPAPTAPVATAAPTLPAKSADQPKDAPQTEPQSAQSGSMAFNLNTCTADDLVQNIPGCFRDLAESIIEHRTNIGSFKRIEDLLDVPGITKAAYTNLTGEAPPENRIPLSLNELLGFPPEENLSLKDVAERISHWPDVTGCVLSQSTGLSLVGNVPEGLDKAAIVAFAPRMFDALNKSFKEITGTETDALLLPTPGNSFHIFRNKDLYLIILSRLPQMPERHMKVARFVLSALSIRRD